MSPALIGGPSDENSGTRPTRLCNTPHFRSAAESQREFPAVKNLDAVVLLSHDATLTDLMLKPASEPATTMRSQPTATSFGT